MVTDLDREIEDFLADTVMRKNLERRTAMEYARDVRFLAQYLASDGDSPATVATDRGTLTRAYALKRAFRLKS